MKPVTVLETNFLKFKHKVSTFLTTAIQKFKIYLKIENILGSILGKMTTSRSMGQLSPIILSGEIFLKTLTG